MSQDIATATATDTDTIVRTPDEIAARLDSWVASQQTCWAILPTPSGVCLEVFGKLCNSSFNGHASYRLNNNDFLSMANFPLSAVESVGQSCIFLKA